jgi:transcriptional regulator with XRE-family HTH domain
MQAAEKQALGLLGGAAIRAFRKQFGLSQMEAAQLFGGGKVGFSRYENDDIVQSQAMDSLLRLCMQHPQHLLALARIRQVSLSPKTLQHLQGDAHQQLLAIAPKVQQILEEALTAQRRQRAAAASNDGANERFAVTERSVWKAAA